MGFKRLETSLYWAQIDSNYWDIVDQQECFKASGHHAIDPAGLPYYRTRPPLRFYKVVCSVNDSDSVISRETEIIPIDNIHSLTQQVNQVLEKKTKAGINYEIIVVGHFAAAARDVAWRVVEEHIKRQNEVEARISIEVRKLMKEQSA